MVEKKSFSGKLAGFPSLPSALKNGGGMAALGEAGGDVEGVRAGEIGAVKKHGLIRGDSGRDLCFALDELIFETATRPIDGTGDVAEAVIKSGADVENQRLARLLELEKVPQRNSRDFA
jgi:hypothetical protein